VAMGTAISCLLGFAVSCTQSDPDDGSRKAGTWYGLARNTCGMADGPAIAFSLDTVAYSGCGNEHEDEKQVWYEGKLVDELVPGQIIKNTLSFCPENECANDTVITLEILDTNATDVHVGFLIESQANSVRKTLHSGKATLAKCRERPMCG
jgi:hypothetical protein